jgi:hypothetical protein
MWCAPTSTPIAVKEAVRPLRVVQDRRPDPQQKQTVRRSQTQGTVHQSLITGAWGPDILGKVVRLTEDNDSNDKIGGRVAGSRTDRS